MRQAPKLTSRVGLGFMGAWGEGGVGSWCK